MLVPSPPLSLMTTVRARACADLGLVGAHVVEVRAPRAAASMVSSGIVPVASRAELVVEAAEHRDRELGDAGRAHLRPSRPAVRRWSWRPPYDAAMARDPGEVRPARRPCAPGGGRVAAARDLAADDRRPGGARRAPRRRPRPGPGRGRHVVRRGAGRAADGGRSTRRSPRAASACCCPITLAGPRPRLARRRRPRRRAPRARRRRPRRPRAGARARRRPSGARGWARGAGATTRRCRGGRPGTAVVVLLHPGELLDADEDAAPRGARPAGRRRRSPPTASSTSGSAAWRRPPPAAGSGRRGRSPARRPRVNGHGR